MTFDCKGIKKDFGLINTLVDYLEKSSDFQIWEYMGLKVEIDPTVDYNDQNVLVRWLDKQEGYNDRLIINSLDEFMIHFKKIIL